MSRIQRLVALIAVGLLGAVGVTGVMAGPGGVLGGGGSSDDTRVEQSGGIQTPNSLVAQSGGETEVKGDVIDCAAGEDTRFKFEQSASEFEVTGTLVSFDGSTVVVTGPDGDVAATVDASAEVKGDPQPGDAVKVEGAVLEDGTLVAREIKSACEAAENANDDQGDDVDDADEREIKGDEIACPSGESTRFKFETEGNEFEVTGSLVSFDGSTVVVTGPSGDVTASVDPGAEIKGDPQAGDPVKVEGAVLDDGRLVAREIEPACDDDDGDDNSGPGGDDGGSADDHGGRGEDDDSDDNSGHDGSDDDSGSGGGRDHDEDD